MSKRPQPAPKQPLKNKPQIVEQQNEPFLKTLQKKVRNINKKLVDIAELELKEHLKPDQVEKVNRKNALIEERARIEETANLYKQAYVENAALYRNAQLRELEVLARAIAILHSGAKVPESARISQLWQDLQQSGENKTLNDAISSLANALKEFANDKKLQKSLATYVEENGNNVIVAQQKAVEVEQVKVEVKPEPVKVEVPVVVAPVVVPTVAVVEPTPAQQKVEVAPVVAETSVVSEAKPVEVVDSKAEKPKNHRENRGKGHYRTPHEQKEWEDRKRKQYKPKYAEKEPEPKETNVKEVSVSSDSDEPEVRNFRREEIRELEEDGYIVLNKPKPKFNHRDQKPHYERPATQKPLPPRKEYIKN